MTGTDTQTGTLTDATAVAPEGGASSLPDTDAGASRTKNDTGLKDTGRVRLCIVTRTECPAEQLIRFVVGPDDSIVPDLAAKLPGRGVWVTATRAAVAEAAKRGLFAKSLKRPVRADKDLADQVENLLLAATRQALSFANKAGLVTTGFAKVESSLSRNQTIGLIAAADASADGTGKLARKFTAIRTAAGKPAPLIGDLTSVDLGLAMGGSNVIHVSLSEGGSTRRFLACCQRLRDFRMISGVAAGAVPPDEAGLDATPAQVQDRAQDRPVSGAACDMTDIETSNSDQAGTDHV